MDGVKLHIDNIEVEGDKGMTILEAAEKAGINIPTLCHHRDFFPTGACRICVVEVEGSNRLVGSCHTPITEGMVIYTQSPKVITARKATVELLLAGHTGPCVMDARTEQCDLHQIASDLGVEGYLIVWSLLCVFYQRMALQTAVKILPVSNVIRSYQLRQDIDRICDRHMIRGLKVNCLRSDKKVLRS